MTTREPLAPSNPSTRVTLAASALFAALGAAGVFATGLRLAWGDALLAFGYVTFLAALAWIYRRRDPKLRALVDNALAAIALSTAYLLPMYALTRLHAPLRDGAYAALDRAVGLDVVGLARGVAARPGLAAASAAAYDSLQVFVILGIAIPSLAGRAEHAARVLLALVVASVVTLAVHGLAPAIGPFAEAGAPASIVQENTRVALLAIRAGRPFSIHLGAPDALIAFPSWHVILATLAAISLGGVRALRPVAALWASAIAASTITTGWHWGVDVVAGFATAALSFAAAGAIERRLAKRSARTSASATRRRRSPAARARAGQHARPTPYGKANDHIPGLHLGLISRSSGMDGIAGGGKSVRLAPNRGRNTCRSPRG